MPRVSLVIDGLRKQFGTIQALDGLTFHVPRGQVFGFLGANGAGKTTTMRIALGVLEADAGVIAWDGVPSPALPRSTWGYLPEERGLYPRMGVLDQLVFFASLYGMTEREARREAGTWMDRFDVSTMADRQADELSKGNQQKVQLISALLHRPQVLLMDEPFTSLDPVNVALLREVFLELRDRGTTLIFSTHQMDTVEAMCESVAIIDRGRVLASGPLRDVKRLTGRRLVHLGVEGDHHLPWLADVPGARILRAGIDRTEVELDDGVEPERVLAAAMARGERVRLFEVADASLEQVFIDLVRDSAAARGDRPAEARADAATAASLAASSNEAEPAA
jgi:ABC-2 type transport system ATP-binding protein